MPTIISKNCLQLMVTRRLAFQTRQQFIYLKYEQGLERYRPHQAPHIKPPISGPPYQTPYSIKPPTISSPPYQALHIKAPTTHHLRPQPTISSPPYQGPHDTPSQAPTYHIKPLIFYRQYDFMTHHIRPRPTISSP